MHPAVRSDAVGSLSSMEMALVRPQLAPGAYNSVTLFDQTVGRVNTIKCGDKGPQHAVETLPVHPRAMIKYVSVGNYEHRLQHSDLLGLSCVYGRPGEMLA